MLIAMIKLKSDFSTIGCLPSLVKKQKKECEWRGENEKGVNV